MDLVRKATHYYKPLTEANRPQDNGDLTFKVVEHGIDSFPLGIRVQDSHGRWCVYVPIAEQGRDVQSHGFFAVDVDLKASKARDIEELPLQPSLDPQRPRSSKPGRFLLPHERQETISRDLECGSEKQMSAAHIIVASTALNSEAFEQYGCYCLVGSMPKTNRDVVNIIRSIFADLLPELQVNVTRPTSDDEFEIVIERIG